MEKIPQRLLLLILHTSLVLIPYTVHAATLEVVPQAIAVGVGQEIRIDVLLHNDGKVLNAVSGTLTLPEHISFQRIEDGESIIGVWLTKPDVLEDGRTVIFSGIVPGGFYGPAGVLFSLYATGARKGEVLLRVADGVVVQNDGKGTSVSVRLPSTTLAVVEKLVVTLQEQRKDTVPPLPFQPVIAQSEDLFEGRYFVIMNTLDAASGIDRYEMYESPVKIISRVLRTKDLRWRTVKNPAPLIDQSLQSFIYIRAMDRAGNLQLVTVLPNIPNQQEKFTYNNWRVLGILGVMVAVFIILFFVRRQKKE